MHVDHHDLHHEFPEFNQAIHDLKVGNHHFARIFEEYHKLTTDVERLEEEDVPVDDFTIEDMKKRRIRLKDELYAMLVAYRK